MARTLLLEASPFAADSGATVTVRLAGGGSRAYTHRGRNDWRDCIVAEPLFTSAIGFGDGGWTGGAIPQTGTIAVASADTGLIDQLAGLVWDNADIELFAGDDALAEPAWSTVLKGKAASISVKGGLISITIADLSLALNGALCPDSFAGSGMIEGGSDGEGRVKRRSFGDVWNIEGRLLDKANNIYEFGDPAYPLQSIKEVRDRGRAGPLTQIAWQGNAAATFLALQAAVVPEGGAAAAPSIACVKWWTVPSGPLTADLSGEIGSGYVDSAAAIAERIIAAKSTLAVTNVAAMIAARPGRSGLHIDTSSETVAQALDRLLFPRSIAWVMTPAGSVQLLAIGLDAPAETVIVDRIERIASYPPITTLKLGYQRNQRIHNDGEISAALPAADLVFPDGTTGADLGAAVQDEDGNFIKSSDLATAIVTAQGDITDLGDAIKDGSGVLIPSNTLANAIAAAQSDIETLFSAGGGGGGDGSASAAQAAASADLANQAKNDTLALKNQTQTARDAGLAAQAAAEGARDQTMATAAAVANTATVVNTRATAAEQAATAAAASNTTATTKAAEATARANNAAASETNAAGSAASAVTNAGIVVAARDVTLAARDATQQYATATATNATSAAASNTAAGQKAAAANESALSATTAAGQASAILGQVVSSLSAAELAVQSASSFAALSASARDESVAAKNTSVSNATASSAASSAANQAKLDAQAANTNAQSAASVASNEAVAANASASSAFSSYQLIASFGGKPNLIANGSAETQVLTPWTQFGTAIMVATVGNYGEGTYFYADTVNQSISFGYRQTFNVEQGVVLSLQAEMSNFAMTGNAYSYVVVRCYNAANTLIDSSLIVQLAAGSAWTRVKAENYTTPTGTKYARVEFGVFGTGTWSAPPGQTAFRRIKVENNATCTAYTNELNAASLQGAITTEQSVRSSADGVLTTQYNSILATVNGHTASITTNASAVATLTAQAATFEQRLLAGQPNLLPNSTFEAGLAQWDAYNGTSAILFGGWGWGAAAFNLTGGTQVLLVSKRIPIYGGNWHTLASDLQVVSSSSSSNAYIDMLFYRADGSLCGDGGETYVYANRYFSTSGAERLARARSDYAPSDAAFAVVRLVANPSGGTISIVALRQVKLELGTTMTPYSGEASAGYQAGVIADHTGKLRSYLSLTTSAGAAAASVKLVAIDTGGNPYSTIGLEAQEITLSNSEGTNKQVALSLKDGTATFGGDIKIGGALRFSNGLKIKLAVQPVIIQVGDGDSITYPNAGYLPIPSFSTVGLAPISATEAYDLKLENQSAGGATVRLKINVPGTPSSFNITSDFPAGFSSGTARYVFKGSNPDATSNQYRIQGNWSSSTYAYRSDEGGPGGLYLGSFYIVVELYAYVGSVWVPIGSYEATEDAYYSSAGLKTRTGTFDVTVSAPTGVSYFAAYGDATLVTSVSWTAPATASSTRSASPNGQKCQLTLVYNG